METGTDRQLKLHIVVICSEKESDHIADWIALNCIFICGASNVLSFNK